MHTLPWRAGRAFVRLAPATLIALAVVLVAGQTVAHAQTVTDPDFWKGTAERQNMVNRLIYGQSPQAIPASYDVVREAEEILAREPGRPTRTSSLSTGTSIGRTTGTSFRPPTTTRWNTAAMQLTLSSARETATARF
jgi:hypothetical protein